VMPATAKKITPASIMTMLRKAKATYLRSNKPDPQSTAEKRHLQLVNELKKLRDLAKKGEQGNEGGAKAFALKRKEVVKKFKDHWKKLKTERDDDPNKSNLEKYRIVLGLLTLKIKGMEFAAALEAGEDEDEGADPSELEIVDLADMEKEEDADEVVVEEVPQQTGTQ